jgi:hypothetical protein
VRFRRKPPAPNREHEVEKEVALVAAEKRANVLYERAEWLYTIVLRRDQENGWQASVNQLFNQGGSTR